MSFRRPLLAKAPIGDTPSDNAKVTYKTRNRDEGYNNCCHRLTWFVLLLVMGTAILGLVFALSQKDRNDAQDAKDMILMQNVSDLDGAILIEESSRIEKDMILMQNVSNLESAIVTEEALRTLKDMVLMQNVSDLQAQILQEESSRIEKDMILMQNVSVLEAGVDMLFAMVPNTTMKLTTLMMDLMMLAEDAVVAVEDGYGTIASLTPESAGQRLRIDLNITAGNNIVITPSPFVVGGIEISADSGVASFDTDLGSPPSLPLNGQSGLKGSTTSGRQGIKTRENGDTVEFELDFPTLVTNLNAEPTMAPTFAPSICAAPACASIDTITGDVGVTTAGLSNVNIVGGSGITTEVIGNSLYINSSAPASSGVLSFDTDLGSPPSLPVNGQSGLKGSTASGRQGIKTRENGADVEFELDFPTLVTNLGAQSSMAPTFAPTICATPACVSLRGVLGISASTGGTAFGPTVSLVGANGITTSHSLNTVTITGPTPVTPRGAGEFLKLTGNDIELDTIVQNFGSSNTNPLQVTEGVFSNMPTTDIWQCIGMTQGSAQNFNTIGYAFFNFLVTTEISCAMGECFLHDEFLVTEFTIKKVSPVATPEINQCLTTVVFLADDQTNAFDNTRHVAINCVVEITQTPTQFNFCARVKSLRRYGTSTSTLFVRLGESFTKLDQTVPLFPAQREVLILKR